MVANKCNTEVLLTMDVKGLKGFLDKGTIMKGKFLVSYFGAVGYFLLFTRS